MGEEDLVKRVEEWKEWMHRNPPPKPQPLGSEPCDDYMEEHLNRMWDISIELEKLNKNIRLLALLQALQVLAISLYLVLRWSR